VARRISQSGTRESVTARRAPLILLVDDCLDTLTACGEFLVEAGYEVALAADGNEALTLALSNIPDLILLDLQMPGLDGWEAARLMRSYWPTRPIPIIALSGHHDSATVRRAADAGCNRFVQKPCMPAELVRIVQSMLEEDAEKRGGIVGVGLGRHRSS
jgi:two-component system, cell cycle response regulator DivK